MSRFRLRISEKSYFTAGRYFNGPYPQCTWLPSFDKQMACRWGWAINWLGMRVKLVIGDSCIWHSWSGKRADQRFRA